MSYRDPNLKRTIDVYEGVVDYLENFTVSDRDMTKYIIGTISNIDQPMTPATKGERSMNLYMNKVSAEMIKKERAQILDASQEDIRALAKVAKAVLAADQLCVIGGEEKIEEDNKNPRWSIWITGGFAISERFVQSLYYRSLAMNPSTIPHREKSCPPYTSIQFPMVLPKK